MSDMITPLSSNSTKAAAARVRCRNAMSPSLSLDSALERADATSEPMAPPCNARSATFRLPADCIGCSRGHVVFGSQINLRPRHPASRLIHKRCQEKERRYARRSFQQIDQFDSAISGLPSLSFICAPHAFLMAPTTLSGIGT